MSRSAAPIRPLPPPSSDGLDLARGRMQFLLPTLFLGGAGLLIVVSLFLPYAHVRFAPAEGPAVELAVYIDHLGGDLTAVEALAPGLLVRPRPDREVLERSLSLAAVVAIVLLGVAAIYVHNQWAALLSLPALTFPLVFLGDFRGWLADLSTSAEVARGGLAIESGVAAGWVLAAVAAGCVVIGLVFHRRAYRRVAPRRV